MILISIRSLTHVYGILTETGICTDGKIIIGNETQILNQSAARYIKNLTMDNRLLAEMVCHSVKWNNCKIKNSVETTSNPFDNESTFLSTDSRREQRRKGKKRKGRFSHFQEQEDPDIQGNR